MWRMNLGVTIFHIMCNNTVHQHMYINVWKDKNIKGATSNFSKMQFLPKILLTFVLNKKIILLAIGL